MDDKERLQEIKRKWLKINVFNEYVYTPKETIDWLISQAEKVEQLQQTVDRLSQENISWQKHEVRQETKIHDLEMKMGKLKQLGDLTLWGVYEIEKYRELVWEEKE